MRADTNHLGIGVRCLFALSASLFIFLPRHAYTSIWGEWFTLGWPFSALALKVGYMTPESPRGPHFQFDPSLVFNAVLWLALFWGIHRVVRAGYVARGITFFLVAVLFLVSAIWFTFGVIQVGNAVAELEVVGPPRVIR